MSTGRVLISTSTFGEADPAPLARLVAEGYEVERNPYGRVLTEDEVAELAREVEGLIAGTEPLTERVLSQTTRLRVISRVGIGLDSVDLDAAERCGVRVLNTPDAVTDAVAELTLGGILALLRHVHVHDADLKAGIWKKRMGGLLRGKTVGIVGLGRIGKALAGLLEPFDARLLGCEVEPDERWAAAHGVELVPLPELLREADVVTLHVTMRGCLLGAAELALLKPGAFLVNTARGGLVDEAALHDALSSKAIAGCYVDTFEAEPYEGPLASLPNALLTPHVGSYAREARARMEQEAVDNLLLVLGGGR